MDMLGAGLSVATSVTAVISAFHDADTHLQRLKVKRVARRLPLPPNLLEETVSGAPEEIDRARRRGVERFGRLFDDGDAVAVITIQQITIQLQSGLLERLRNPSVDHEETDFLVLIDLADSARDGTVSALIALRTRLMQSGSTVPVPAIVHSSVPPPAQFATRVPLPHAVHPALRPQLPLPQPPDSLLPSRQSSIAPPIPSKDSRRPIQDFLAPQAATARRGSDQSVGDENQHRSPSLFGRFKRKPVRTPSSEHLRAPNIVDPRLSRAPSSFSGPSNVHEAVPPLRGHQEGSPPFTPREADGSHFEILAPYPTRPSVHAGDTRSTISGRSRTNSMISSSASTAPTVSTHPPLPSAPATILATPSPQNDFLGFCKGAWRAQNDDPKAMIDRRDFAQSAHSQMTFPSCSKCEFKGHQDSRLIWNKVNVDEARGLKYRWSFLAKSHVKQKSVKERHYAYQCLFCVFMGQKEPIIYTQNTYLDHISKDHRKELLDDVVLYRSRCVKGRICENNEKFDINLFPIEEKPLVDKSHAFMFDQLSTEMKAFELAA